MSLYAKMNDQDFEPIPMELQHAVCSHVLDLGIQHSETYGDKHQVALCFELEAKMQDGRPFMISKIYGLTTHKKSSLFKDLEVWRGKTLPPEERESFDLEKLIGANCYINIAPNEKDGKTYGKITSINKLPAGFPKIAPAGQPAPEWLTKKAAEGVERLAKLEAEQPKKADLSKRLPFDALITQIEIAAEISEYQSLNAYINKFAKDYAPAEVPQILNKLSELKVRVEKDQQDLPF